MSLRALFFDGEGGPLQPRSTRARIGKVTWTMWGGAEMCEMWLEDQTLEEARGLLGAGVELVNGIGRVVWRGYADTAAAEDSLGQRELSLEQVVNRARLSYLEQPQEGAIEPRVETAWAEDVLSQGVYGVREKVIRAGLMSREDAELQRDLILREGAWVKARAASGHKKRTPEKGHSAPGEVSSANGVWLRCLGWAADLARTVWEDRQGILGNMPGMNGFFSLDENSQNSLLAQAFTLEEETALVGVSIRARKAEGAQDGITAQVRGDQDGLPGTTALTSASLPAESMDQDHYGWTRANFSAPIQLAAGKYWLVLGRNAPAGGGYYRLGADTSLEYSPGRALAFDSQSQSWVNPEPEADLLFRIWTAQNSKEILTKAIETGWGGAGRVSMPAEGVVLHDWKGNGKTCLEVARETLALGSASGKPLRAMIAPGRVFRVEEVPDGEIRTVWSRGGNPRDLAGGAFEEGVLPVGEWIEVEGAEPVLVHSAGMEGDRVWVSGD